MSNDYGPFSNIVALSGSIVAMGAAVGFAFRRRAKWEPVEEDLSKGPQKIGGLFASISIAVLFLTKSKAEEAAWLGHLSIALGIVATLSLLLYGVLITTLTFEKDVATGDTTWDVKKIIGGFWRLREAAQEIRALHITTQEYFKGVQYDADLVWPRISRALSKQAFVLSYLVLTVSGTVALAAAAIMISNRT